MLLGYGRLTMKSKKWRGKLRGFPFMGGWGKKRRYRDRDRESGKRDTGIFAWLTTANY
jgi:hypothetical protein